MARRRMLSRDASTDPDLNALSVDAQLLFLLTLLPLSHDHQAPTTAAFSSTLS